MGQEWPKSEEPGWTNVAATALHVAIVGVSSGSRTHMESTA